MLNVKTGNYVRDSFFLYKKNISNIKIYLRDKANESESPNFWIG